MDEPAESPSETAPVRSPRRWILAAVLATPILFAAYQAATWPDVGALAEADPETTAFIEHDRARRTDGEGEAIDWRPVSYGRISDHLKVAVLVAEDIGFFDHDGFETAEIKAAVRDAVKEGKKLRGASTLSQQLARNLWLSPSRNPWRKVKEALLTVELERRLDKRRIFELYLNVAEMGPGVYGAEAAARRYFGRSAAALGPDQAARMAAALPSPKRWHPGSGSAAAERRAGRIRARMRQAAWLHKVI